MKRFFLTLAFLFLYWGIIAQIPAGYYSSAYGEKGKALQITLFNIIKDHDVQSYNSLWGHFLATDRKPNGKVWDMYSDIPNGTPPYEFTFGTNQCGNVSANEGYCYNREHSLPKSWFNDAQPMLTDLFHIYPTDGQVNNRRSNYAFGEVRNASWTSRNGSKVGQNTYPGYSGIVFEPRDDFKGDFARTYFYMATRYMDRNLGQESNSMFTGSQLNHWALNMLIEWHQNDPVSQKETDRNNEVYEIQNNRNPFIDYPELVGKIFGADSVNAFSPVFIHDYQTSKAFIVYPNPASNEVFFYGRANDIIEIELLDIQGRVLFYQNSNLNIDNNKVDLSLYIPGIYILKINFGSGVEVHKIIKQ